MSLTATDLVKIEKLVENNIENSPYLHGMKAELKSEISGLKDLLTEMHFAITTELPLISKRVDNLEDG